MQETLQTELLSPLDAAKVLVVSTATVKRLADELRLPVIRTRGGVRLFPGDQVQAMKAERERRAAARNP
jgi:excisionase family DNA binding protein